MKVEVKLPKWATQNLFRSQRYKVMYGGRGSGKSWAVATYLVIEAAQKPLRILCAREFQKSIKESAHKLIADRISSLGLSEMFEVGESFIRSKSGAEFVFLGLKHNITQIKSLEGIDKVWVEEAQTISEASWDTLIPTIRKPKSEIIVTFNPENEDDATYKMFVTDKMPDSWVMKVNHDLNPWFPDELEFERQNLLASGEKDKYDHIWNGACKRFAGGAVYGKWMADAEDQGRITSVPYNPAAPVITSWDLGYSDATAIWFLQIIGKEPRMIDYYEANLMSLDHYVNFVRSKPYNYQAHILPHDAGHQSLRTGTTMADQIKGMGLTNVEVLSVDAVETGIELVRQLIPQLWFDREKCKAGINALKKYHYEYDEERKVFRPKPQHDWSSNGSDSVRYMATYVSTMRTYAPPPQYQDHMPRSSGATGLGWMG